MQTTIYIRKENENQWNSLEDKSAWVNDQLSRTPNVVPNEPIDDEWGSNLDDLVFSLAGNCVYDTTTGEAVEADAAMIKELKRRRQVK